MYLVIKMGLVTPTYLLFQLCCGGIFESLISKCNVTFRADLKEITKDGPAKADPRPD